MRPGYDEAPLNPLPGVVWLLLLPLVAMEAVIGLGKAGLAGGGMGEAWRNDALQRFALPPQLLEAMVDRGQYPLEGLWRFVTYIYVHGSFTHAIFVAVFLLALGKMVAEVYKAWSVIVIFFGAGLFGGIVYSLVPGISYPLFGGYPAVYGLIGTFTFMLWARLGAENANRFRAFTLIGFLLGIQLIFGVLFGGTPDWIADLAGFGFGFGASFVVGPGGPAYLLARIRQR
ncbi:rhomboid family intramembrane serine protease [Albidovulum sediminicola]|uniref:Rhomboid family intramembrane serine protease n=1 Tax=Albidovulum sediminicola TaxID=2984331 RepID=A0ABT2Z2N7_9RHOB|nr:rhomboid family intramembrane serine protease [Defluviimonas sp. WL0075]MCV2865282.1 rhomboid family intramembrane serine protease [Defluviimonas sp. WL0075]